jgi:hypothetical protein
VSCGKKINKDNPGTINSDINYLLIEKNCQTSLYKYEPETAEVGRLFREFQLNYPMQLLNVLPRYYDYKTPLRLSLKSFDDSTFLIKKKLEKIKDLSIFELSSIGEEIFHLEQNANRYESLKCQFLSLSKKMSEDPRPYLEMKDACVEKTQNGQCTQDFLSKLNPKELRFFESRALKLCSAFSNDSINCQAQFYIQKQSNSLPQLIDNYHKKFKSEKLDKLYTLKEKNRKFSCLKNEDSGKIHLTVKVINQSWDEDTFEMMLQSIKSQWSIGTLVIDFERVSQKTEDVLEIKSSGKMVSHVPKNEPSKILISNQLTGNVFKLVLGHEFGHVLGFPDCYNEFFDSQKKELIYFEFNKEDRNLMCTIKLNSVIPAEYITQLIEKSCVF